MTGTFAGKRYIVTGGSSGIGLEIARGLLDGGAAVAILGRDEGRLQAAKKALGVKTVQADVSIESEAIRGLSEAVGLLGGLDGLINNAGRAARGRIEDVEAAEFAAVLATNLIGPMTLMKAALPHLEASGGGDVVNIGSTASLKGYRGGSMYAASKFGLRALSECWRDELRPRQIRVMHVNPSEVQTPFGGRPDSVRVPNKLFAEDVAQAVLGALSMNPRAFVPEISIWATNPWEAGS